MRLPGEPGRGEIWSVNLDPTLGEEMGKTRPVVVVSGDTMGKLNLRVVVPLTGWQPGFRVLPWMTAIPAGSLTGLQKDSSADGFQVSSLSLLRFKGRVGEVTEAQLKAIVESVALVIEHE